MTKVTAKQMTTAVIATLIMLMIFAIFVLVERSNDGDLSYIYDDVNTCIWEGDVIVSSTEAFDSELTIERVSQAERGDFLDDSRDSSACIARLGSTSGFYATQLNEQYEKQ